MPEPSLSPISQDAQDGFSLVELLVALVFMAVLMAGMAKVFQSSMNTFYRSSESISSGRRNRMAMDLLFDDLNAAGQYLTNLTSYPTFSATAPGFYILPNQTYTGTDVPTAEALTDQLNFYLDEALPFEGRLYASAGATFAQTSNADLVSSQADVAKLDTTMEVMLSDPSYAKTLESTAAEMVKNNQGSLVAVFKDQWGPMAITGVTQSGSTPLVTFKPQAVPDTEMGLSTGINPLNKDRHFAGDGTFTTPGTINGALSTGGAPVLFVRPAQMVRYSIQARNLDPANPNVGIPCLIRQQGTYASGGFVPDDTLESIIAEDVTGFKVYLSAYQNPDPTKTTLAATWAGWGSTANDFDSGWTSGILATVNTQLSSLGLPSAPNTNDPNWFRNTPLVVRVDLTTRSAIKRAENSATGNIAAYQERTQTLYMVPRHFGLSFN